MITWVLRKLLGTKSERDIKKLKPVVAQVNALEEQLSALEDSEIQAQALALKAKVQEELNPHYEHWLSIKKNSGDPEQIKQAKEQLQKEQKNILDKVLPEAFALVREAGKRVMKMRHYDVQLMGGIVLHEGKIAEMATGEGKTLVATLPVFLNALTGRGVHVITVNDYLAKRDCQWMGPLYQFLGLSVGVVVNDLGHDTRKKAYACDITYGTNNEFGFDYLRDNMVVSNEEQVQRPLNYCIVDEVDSILIDEARTPLIISGPVDTVSHCYNEVKGIVRELVNRQEVLVSGLIKQLDKAIEEDVDDEIGRLVYLIHRGAPKDQRLLALIAQHGFLKKVLEQTITRYSSKEAAKDRQALEEELLFIYDEKSRDVILSVKGEEFVSKDFPGQFQLEDITETISEIQSQEELSLEEKSLLEHDAYKKHEDKSKRIRSFEQLLKAYVLFKKDVDYVIVEDKVVIVDEFTGRMMPGRRFSEGLHEALEAKEGVDIQRESQTLATITFQNYFRMYLKLSGMTGTADTEATEFHEIYKLDVVVVPTNKVLQRVNHPDVIYKTEKEKFYAVANEVEQEYRKGRPVLVGTVSIEKSEQLSGILKRKKIIHEVLNAKNHAREAEIISLAGQSGAVTIATNMAGRGTDIVLGEGVYDKGGLHVVGTERHESRRIDNQLRGRSGRQGDPGSSKFFLSLEDDLMRIFGSDRIARVMNFLGMKEGEEIQHTTISRAIETAQRRVESHNFDIRKWLLKYDDVMNKQREVIYDYRQSILEKESLEQDLFEMVDEVLQDILEEHYEWVKEDFSVAEDDAENPWNRLSRRLMDTFRLMIPKEELEKVADKHLKDQLFEQIKKEYLQKISILKQDEVARYVRYKLLETVDKHWKEHLYVMDELRESVNLRAYGQIDPLQEYQKESHRLFQELIENIRKESVVEVFAMPIMHITEDIMNQLRAEATNFVHPDVAQSAEEPAKPKRATKVALSNPLSPSGGDAPYQGMPSPQIKTRPAVKSDKVGRNDLCPCGSGKKHKKCCGR